MISGEETAAVYAANDIIYYEEGRDLAYGEGTEEDAHSAKEAAAHTVVHITQSDCYTCGVAPAVIFCHLYACGSADAETATKDVDTSAAGANVMIADGTINDVNGSYVARIYKPDTVELSEDGAGGMVGGPGGMGGGFRPNGTEPPQMPEGMAPLKE